jgi:hypothetical protein
LVQEIEAMKFSDLTTWKPQWDSPFLITGLTEIAALKGTRMQSMLEFLLKPFVKDPKFDTAKGGAGRGQQRPKNDEIRLDMRNMLYRVLGEHADKLMKYDVLLENVAKSGAPADIADMIMKTFDAQLFGLQKNLSHYGTEKFGLGCMRFATHGTRQIVVIKAKDVAEAIAADGGANGAASSHTFWNTCTQEQMKAYFDKASEQKLGVFARAYKIEIIKVGVHELFFCPHGSHGGQICVFVSWVGLWSITCMADCRSEEQSHPWHKIPNSRFGF